jgi:hypothetical protein
VPETTTIPGPSTVGAAPAPSVGQLVSSVSADLSLLVQKEVELAKLEISAAAKKAAIGAGGLVVAGVLLIPAVLFASIAGAEALALVVSRWLAFLVVAAIYLLFAVIGALFGRSQLKKIQKPERTQKTVKDTIAWAKHPTQGPATGLTAGQVVSTPAALTRKG